MQSGSPRVRFAIFGEPQITDQFRSLTTGGDRASVTHVPAHDRAFDFGYDSPAAILMSHEIAAGLFSWTELADRASRSGGRDDNGTGP